MKNILLLVHDDAGQESRYQAAVDLTRALNGHLICLEVSFFPVFYSDLYGKTQRTATFGDEDDRERRNRERLERRLAGEGVPWTWLDTMGDPATEIIERSALADIIVVSLQLNTETLPDTRAIASEVVVESGTTVVAVPEYGRRFNASGHVLLAWDGSSEATKALRSTVPLLQLAGAVTIVQVDDGSIRNPAEEAAAYLSRHGIFPTIVHRDDDDMAAADLLIEEALAQDADFIVMGGFGRSRFLEAVLGGVSRKMLTASPVPVVMMH